MSGVAHTAVHGVNSHVLQLPRAYYVELDASKTVMHVRKSSSDQDTRVYRRTHGGAGGDKDPKLSDPKPQTLLRGLWTGCVYRAWVRATNEQDAEMMARDVVYPGE